MKEITKRLERIHNLSDTIDALVIPNFPKEDPNFFYFTNTNIRGIFYYDFSKPIIFTSNMEYSRANRGWVKNIVEFGKGMDIKEILKGKKLGVNKSLMSASFFSRLKNRKVDISSQLDEVRMIKTKYEVATIRKACKISGKVFDSVKREINGKITELELKGLVEYFIAKYGCIPAFSTIVATGKNIAEPHHLAENKKLEKTVLIDFGVRYKGYVSDVTRTIGSKYEKIVKNAIEKSLEKIHVGAKASDIDRTARDALGKLSKHFITSLGHGFGIAVHEIPNISSKSNDTIKNSMTITIEPGIYVNNGIRLENDYIITNNGPKTLTDF